jgi:hypothetical protein
MFSVTYICDFTGLSVTLKCELLNISDLYTGDLVIPVNTAIPVLDAEFVI